MALVVAGRTVGVFDFRARAGIRFEAKDSTKLIISPGGDARIALCGKITPVGGNKITVAMAMPLAALVRVRAKGGTGRTLSSSGRAASAGKTPRPMLCGRRGRPTSLSPLIPYTICAGHRWL